MAWEIGDLLTKDNNLYLVTDQRKQKRRVRGVWVELDFYKYSIQNLSNGEVFVVFTNGYQKSLEAEGWYVAA